MGMKKEILNGKDKELIGNVKMKSNLKSIYLILTMSKSVDTNPKTWSCEKGLRFAENKCPVSDHHEGC